MRRDHLVGETSHQITPTATAAGNTKYQGGLEKELVVSRLHRSFRTVVYFSIFDPATGQVHFRICRKAGFDQKKRWTILDPSSTSVYALLTPKCASKFLMQIMDTDSGQVLFTITRAKGGKARKEKIFMRVWRGPTSNGIPWGQAKWNPKNNGYNITEVSTGLLLVNMFSRRNPGCTCKSSTVVACAAGVDCALMNMLVIAMSMEWRRGQMVMELLTAAASESLGS